MSFLTDGGTYPVKIRRYDLVTPVKGGDGGDANLPLQDLADRTAYLKATTDALSTAMGAAATANNAALTGSPTAPTAAGDSDGTVLATTAFAQRAIGGILDKAVVNGNNALTAVEAGYGVIRLTGALAAGGYPVLIVPNLKRRWTIINKTTGGNGYVMIKAAAGDSFFVYATRARQLCCDGASVYDPISNLGAVYLAEATAPTQDEGDSSASLATTAYVDNAVANVGSPGAATTGAYGLVLLASAAETAAGAIGNKAVVPSAVKPLLDAKAPVWSPSLQGSPQTVTVGGGDWSNSIASTAFVRGWIDTRLATSNPTFSGTIRGDAHQSYANGAGRSTGFYLGDGRDISALFADYGHTHAISIYDPEPSGNGIIGISTAGMTLVLSRSVPTGCVDASGCNCSS